MNDSDIYKAYVEMHQSLTDACDEAHGYMALDFIAQMSALELLAHLATNNIRFTYIGETSGKIEEFRTEERSIKDSGKKTRRVRRVD